jgi:hypothetical protein
MSTRKSLFMESTEIPVQKTAGEILSLLVRAGATQVSLDYKGAKITGMRFTYPVDGHDVPFRLPVRTEPIFQIINGRRTPDTWKQFSREQMAEKDREQADRVAWRQLLRWIEAQIAMIETGMVKTDEVFLPYAATASGVTLYEQFIETGMAARLLPAPEAR